MKELTGNIWDVFPSVIPAIAITTNGVIDAKGLAVMGAGIALQAKNRYGFLPKLLADNIIYGGNHVHYLQKNNGCEFYSFPTKNNWKDKSPMSLIKQSCIELMDEMNIYGTTQLVMTRPGCGNGGLDWNYVKPIIETLLDDRVYIIAP